MFGAQFSPRARSALDRGRDFFPLQRLDEIIIDPGVQNRLAINIIMPSGGDDHLGGRKFFPDRPAPLQTTELWHQEMDKDHYRPAWSDTAFTTTHLMHLYLRCYPICQC